MSLVDCTTSFFIFRSQGQPWEQFLEAVKNGDDISEFIQKGNMDVNQKDESGCTGTPLEKERHGVEKVVGMRVTCVAVYSAALVCSHRQRAEPVAPREFDQRGS